MADLTTLRFELSQLQSKPRTAQVITAIYYKQKEISAEEAKIRNPPVYNISLPVGASVESKQVETNNLIDSTNTLTEKSNDLISQTNILLQHPNNSPTVFQGNVTGDVFSVPRPYAQRLTSYVLANAAAGSNTINASIEGESDVSITQINLQLNEGDVEKDTSNLIILSDYQIKISSTDSLDYYMVLERI